MSGELQDRRFVVLLPNSSGEESDVIAGQMECAIREDGYHAAKVEHALGETLPGNMRIVGKIPGDTPPTIEIWQDAEFGRSGDLLTLNSLYEVRQLAGALLAIPGVIDAEP